MVIFPVGLRDVLFSKVHTHRLRDPTNPSFKGQRALFQGLMCPRRELASPSSAKFKHE